MTTVAIAKSAPARIRKGKLGVYFAWGAFAKYDGEPFVDEHGDDIPGDEFVGAALTLAKSAKLGHEHDGTVNGSVPLVFPLTEDIQTALELTSPHAGLAVGFQPVGEMAKSLEAGDEWELSIAGMAEAHAVAATLAKSADGIEVLAKAKHKRTLRNLVIDEISLVKRGAHGAGTKIAIAKRGDGNTSTETMLAKAAELLAASAPIVKRAPALTGATNGHQHLIDDAECPDGFTSWERAPGAEYGHSHPWVRAADGSLTVGESDGHTHAISTGDATMADDITKSLQADLAKARATLGAVLALPAEQLTYAKRLDEAGVIAYLAKSATERAELAKPVHVAKSGEVFYASDDVRLVSMAKAHDAMAEQVELAKAAAATAEIAKAAAALPNVKGADLIAKAIHGGALTADERKSALADLAAVNASIALITQPIGKGGAPEATGAAAQLDALASEIAKTKGVPFAKAYDLALESPAGAALYAQLEADKRAAGR